MLLAEHILKMTSPEELFPAGKQECKRVFRDLARTWHPDVCKEDKVFTHISVLYEKALEDTDKGAWDYRAEKIISCVHNDGSVSHIPYFVRHPFELGVSYIGKESLFYIIDAKHEKFLENAIKQTNSYKYADEDMQLELSRYLPAFKRQTISDNKVLLTTARRKEFISLRTILESYENKVHSSDVMWILSGIYNICCYFSWSGVVHGDLSLDSCFIDPAAHMSAVLGSWFYCQPIGSTLTQITPNAAKVVPWAVRKEKKALPILDLELVKKIGRDLLGENIKNAPPALLDWLQTPAESSANHTYKKWRHMLEVDLPKVGVGLGFHKMVILDTDVYK